MSASTIPPRFCPKHMPLGPSRGDFCGPCGHSREVRTAVMEHLGASPAAAVPPQTTPLDDLAEVLTGGLRSFADADDYDSLSTWEVVFARLAVAALMTGDTVTALRWAELSTESRRLIDELFARRRAARSATAEGGDGA